jgi:outer membrane protein TolC
MRLSLPICHLRVVGIAAALLAPSASLRAQSGPSVFGAAFQAAAARLADQPDATGVVRRLSMDDAVALALEQNLDIRIQRINPQIQDVGVAQAKSFWAPSFISLLSRQSQTLQSTSALSGGATSILNNTVAAQVGINQALPWGATYAANVNNSRFTSTNLFATFSPQLNSTVNLQYTQPLVRNLSIDQIRQQVQTSRKTRELSDIQLQAVVTQTVRNVKNAYWDLSYAIAYLKAQQQSLALSQRSLRDNQRRADIGTMAPIDLLQAKAEVASNEQGVIIADAAIKAAQDNLRVLMLDPGTADFWTVSFDPTDVAEFAAHDIDVTAAVRNALDKRSDLQAAQNSLAQSDINLHYFHNQVLPDVSAQFNYITTAAGGSELSPVNLAAITGGGSPNRSILSDRGFGSVLGDVLRSTYPNWAVGVQIGYPLGSSTAQANLARARLQYEQAQTQRKSLELQVAAQVRASARNVQTNAQRVQSAITSRELQEQKLDAEEKKFAVGLSSPFFVIQAQRDLSVARVAEIQAISDYNKSLVDFDAVQLVPLGGPGGGNTATGITTAGSGALQAGGSAIIRQQ